MVKIIGVVGIIGIASVGVYKLIKEIRYLDRVAAEVASLHVRMEILYSKLMDRLVAEGLTDRDRLIAIWECLSGYRTATV